MALGDPGAEVRVVGVEIPFMDLVALLVKVALAAIPAVIILAVLGAVVVGVVAGVAGS